MKVRDLVSHAFSQRSFSTLFGSYHVTALPTDYEDSYLVTIYGVNSTWRIEQVRPDITVDWLISVSAEREIRFFSALSRLV